MKPELKLFILLLSLLLIAKPAVAGLVSHPVFGNISALCKRQPACIARQEIAMRQSLAYLTTRKPTAAKVALAQPQCGAGQTQGRLGRL